MGLIGASPGPGYDNRSFGGFVEVTTTLGKTQLQPLADFLVQPAGRQTGYAQVSYQLTVGAQAGQLAPPQGFQTVDERGVAGVDTHALLFELLPGVPADAVVPYTIFAAAAGTYAGNTEDFLVVNDRTGTRLGAKELSPATVSTLPAPTLPALSINDVTVTEGNAGSVNATFTVALSQPSTQTVTVQYATADGAGTNPATAGSDYTAASGTLTFAPGVTSQTVTVAVAGDAVDEFDEAFTVNLSAPTGATIADGQGVGTIADDDAPPALSISDVTVAEGHSTVNAVFTVSLSAPSGKTVTVNVATADGATDPATAGSDYNAVGFTKDGVDVSSAIQSVAFALNPATNKFEATVNLSPPLLATGNYVLTARGSLRDLAGNALDGNFDGTPGGGDVSFSFTVVPNPPADYQWHCLLRRRRGRGEHDDQSI